MWRVFCDACGKEMEKEAPFHSGIDYIAELEHPDLEKETLIGELRFRVSGDICPECLLASIRKYAMRISRNSIFLYTKPSGV